MHSNYGELGRSRLHAPTFEQWERMQKWKARGKKVLIVAALIAAFIGSGIQEKQRLQLSDESWAAVGNVQGQ